jgi:hypothetical protein
MEIKHQCTNADAEHNHLLDGIRMSTEAKVRYFEEMVSLIVAVGARDYLAREPAESVQVTESRG